MRSVLGIWLARLPFERQIFTVTAAVTLDRTEADLDHHLVLRSRQTHDDRRDAFAALHDRRDGVPAPADAERAGRRQDLPEGATGVAFFDYQHGQTGVAPNAIELHPVLGFACLSQSENEAGAGVDLEGLRRLTAQTSPSQRGRPTRNRISLKGTKRTRPFPPTEYE
jgi:hypothetical protein